MGIVEVIGPLGYGVVRQYQIDDLYDIQANKSATLDGERGILLSVHGDYPSQTGVVLFSKEFQLHGYRTTTLILPLYVLKAVI